MSKRTGRKIVNATPSSLVEVEPHFNKVGVLIYSDTANTDTLWVGFTNTLTANQSDLDGFPLFVGKTLELEIANPTEIFIRSTSLSSQKIWFLML